MADRKGLEEAIRHSADPLVLMKRVADEAMNLLHDVDGVLIGFVQDPAWLTIECGSGRIEEHVGKRLPVEGSLAGLAYQTGETVHSDDAEYDPLVDADFTRTTGIKSVVCVPLWRGDQTVGALCVASLRRRAFNDRDVATVASLGEFISVVIAVAFDLSSVTEALLSCDHRHTSGKRVAEEHDREAEDRFVANVLEPGTMRRVESRTWIDRFLRGRGLSHVFQPIYDLTSGGCFAVEALARFSGRPTRSPDVWFAEAHEMGVGVELEVASVMHALSCLDELPTQIDLCVNAGPEAIVSEELRQLLADCDARRIVIELTEEAKVHDYPRLSAALERLYPMGVRLAIDDTGAGFASLAHILKLAPNIIKLDRELTSGIDRDPVRITLATALVSFAAGLGAEIVAEGIETKAELDRICELGIRYGQGFYLSPPTSLGNFPARLPHDFVFTSRHSDDAGTRSGQLLAFHAPLKLPARADRGSRARAHD